VSTEGGRSPAAMETLTDTGCHGRPWSRRLGRARAARPGRRGCRGCHGVGGGRPPRSVPHRASLGIGESSTWSRLQCGWFPGVVHPLHRETRLASGGAAGQQKARENISALLRFVVGTRLLNGRCTETLQVAASRRFGREPGNKGPFTYSTAGGTAPRAGRFELHRENVESPRESQHPTWRAGWLGRSTRLLNGRWVGVRAAVVLHPRYDGRRTRCTQRVQQISPGSGQ